MSTFSERLKEIRKIKNLTQKQIAIGTDMAERQYQFYEYGKREPTISTLKNFVLFLMFQPITYSAYPMTQPDTNPHIRLPL